jgi:hypothetical protein
VAEREGAHVLDLAVNVGKPAALHRALHDPDFAEDGGSLLDSYEHIAILDDDTTIAPDFIHRCVVRMRGAVAIVVGRTLSAWPAEHRWNVLVGNRMYAYWKFQAGTKRGQSIFNAVNCVAGSNSMYRSDLLRQVVRADTPYIVDDCFWTHETHRRGLGRIVYAPEAHAWVQDPTTLRDWAKQNTRWLWGTFQAMWGHGVLRRASWLDFWYFALVLDWFLYVVGAPALFLFLVLTGAGDWIVFLGVYVAGYIVWGALAALATGKWRLIVMAPDLRRHRRAVPGDLRLLHLQDDPPAHGDVLPLGLARPLREGDAGRGARGRRAERRLRDPDAGPGACGRRAERPLRARDADGGAGGRGAERPLRSRDAGRGPAEGALTHA